MPPTAAAPAYARIAESLWPRIGRGAEEDNPTVRAVANEFKVSIMTAARALQTVKSRQAAAARETVTPPAVASRWAVCLHVTPGPHRQAAYQITAGGFEALARQTGMHFDLETVRMDDAPPSDEVARRVRAAAAGVTGLFLLPSRGDGTGLARDEALLAAADALGLPVVLLERNVGGTEQPLTRDLVCLDDFSGGQALTRHLIERGRRRVAFLTASAASSHTERLGGYLTAAVTAGLPPLVVNQPQGVSPREAYTAVAARVAELAADAVICYHDYAAVGLVVELLRRRVSVPADVAVAGFYGMPIGESFSIGVTTYDFPAVTAAERAVDLMRWRQANPTAPPTKWVIPGELIVRESTDCVATTATGAP